MKILMLGWELPPYNSGGLGVACYQLCKALAARGADIEFVLPYRHDQPVEFMTVTTALPQTATALWSSGGAYDSLEYTAVRHSTRLTVADQQRRYAAAVEKLVEERSFDVIHAHDWLTFRAALAAKARTGWPLIVHVHSLECDRAGQEHGGNPLVREIEAAGMLLADRIIAVSERTKAAMVREYGIPADKIEVIHNSLDAAELTPLDPANAYHYLASMKSHGYQVVASIGRLTIQKGLTNLLRAAADVIARVPQTLFLIVGSGEQYAELIELAAELGIARNVIFTDFQRGKKLRDAYAVAGLFVLPSVSEPFGLTPLEAGFYGTPSLISHQAGVSEVFRNCLKVDYWDTHEMANQIVAVLEQPALHDELQVQAAQELERLSWNASADALFKLYEQHQPGALA